MSSPRRSLRVLIAAAVVVLVALGVGAYFLWIAATLPGPDSPVYREYVNAFEVGLAALDTERAQEIGGESLNKAVEIVPQEPAGWADRGLMYLRATITAMPHRTWRRPTSWRRGVRRSRRCWAGWPTPRENTPTPSRISKRPWTPNRAISAPLRPGEGAQAAGRAGRRRRIPAS